MAEQCAQRIEQALLRLTIIYALLRFHMSIVLHINWSKSTGNIITTIWLYSP